ncbi:MAG: hypothetical protein K2X77_31705, partial [Candidatus Obscuribacterales bacterium]|nr:hypothetical protein [Candidatus Obscuribacterales bacterium]
DVTIFRNGINNQFGFSTMWLLERLRSKYGAAEGMERQRSKYGARASRPPISAKRVAASDLSLPLK